jgi:D-alanyl-D-alanine carboxypeptidase (penicillin-binding protein 5/6)
MNKRRKQKRNANLFKAGTAVFLLVLIFIGAFTARYLSRHSRRTDSAASVISADAVNYRQIVCICRAHYGTIRGNGGAFCCIS